eukprot:CAMPEP_0204826682 /NCGR_PEP_ID=MMETSP1346-20131115/4314_1 /ASSEMBLY_ACC=CAM_ASM_000771 /TAXON_ID=215587 /ORGANISM="Aplanochytrium stocchinoi, Strain GSBS06" /LENGTH=132 /DNA_ID=CAMNT_0051954793 /DNA_START=351 /DNA_END=749 /DNA_ORIENTATION=+
MAATGLGLGTHALGTTSVDIVPARNVKDISEASLQSNNDIKAVVSGMPNVLAGSVITMDQCVRNLKVYTDCSIVYALMAASTHPARCLGIYPKKGSLDIGSDADFVLLDNDLHVQATIIKGEIMYKTSQVFN